jgi:UDP-N-acetyl-2-amino-2-deoxyglucuronate dehydrogenase
MKKKNSGVVGYGRIPQKVLDSLKDNRAGYSVVSLDDVDVDTLKKNSFKEKNGNVNVAIVKKRRVGIIGCGHILIRHLESIRDNSDYFELVALCDIDEYVLKKALKDDKVPGYTEYKKMLEEMKGKMDFVVIATPNHLHYKMAMDALGAGYDILVEKPIAFEASKVKAIQNKADKLGKEAFCVLQVRYNPTVKILRQAVSEGLIGKIRSVSFVQRWQRPVGYFRDWRGKLDEGGKSLYEYAIHYLDIVQGMFGVPKVFDTELFNHKHMDIPFEDTLFSIVKYDNGASGTIEVNVAVEPSNLECSISIMGSKGYVEIGGNALDVVVRADFEERKDQKKWDKMKKDAGEALIPNSYGTHVGSCPNHPTLYEEIAKGNGFPVSDAVASIKFIEKVYAGAKK